MYRDRQHYHQSLQTLVESKFLWDLLFTDVEKGCKDEVEDTTDEVEDTKDEIEDTTEEIEDSADGIEDSTDEIEDAGKRLLHLYNKIYFRVITEANIIVVSCHDAGVDDLYENFRPTVAIVDNCNLASEPEAWIPLLMYKDIRFRILLGNRSELRPHKFPANDPWASQRQLSLLERFASTEVPVHELTNQFIPLEADLKHEADPDEVGGRGTIARNKPCPCGSRKKYKKCCGIHEEYS